MSTFNETLHPRGQAANAGQFASKSNDAPENALQSSAVTELVELRIENTYEDGHESIVTVRIPGPDDPNDEDDVDAWWDDDVFTHTGDGYGAKHPKLGCFYEATVISGPSHMVGTKREWG